MDDPIGKIRDNMENVDMAVASETHAKPVTHSIRICNQEHVISGCVAGKEKDDRQKLPAAEELPDGWVRHKNGLMFDVPITPRMMGGNKGAVQLPHYNFTKGGSAPPVKELHRNLRQIDKDAVRRMKHNQDVKIKAARPNSDARAGATYRRGTSVTRKPYEASCQERTPMKQAMHAGGDDRGTVELANRKMAAMKRDHERELIKAKQEVLAHVDGLVKKYRQLAIDAVKVAREEQSKAEAERRRAYEACVRYEADLKANVRGAIEHLKQSAQAEQERLIEERDALQKRCADLTPLSAETFRPTLEHVTEEIVSQFKGNKRFTIDMIDETHSTINMEFAAFRDSMAKRMIERFEEEGCSLKKEDADIFVECSLLAGSMFS